jgi:hypothetical protein
LTPQQLFGWLRVARRRMARESGKNEPAFAPVIVEASRSSSIEPRPGGWALIEMVIGAVTVRIPPGIDAVTLMTVLRAVRAAA